jgi:ABC-type Fe3+/spermidine/putrescine transport system ATPase subunit
MLDEPLGSLDRTLKERLLTELRMILRELQLTTLYVTHDQEEAFTIADQVILLNQGSIEQIGTPQDIYHSPASLFVAKFLGFKNILTAFGEGNFAQTPLGMLPLPASVHGEFTLLIRPDAILPAQDGSLNLQGNIVEKLFQGSLCRTTVDIQGTLLQFNFSSQACALAENQPISLSLDPQKAFLILPKP